MVISRSGTGKVGATHLRDILNGDLYFTSQNQPLAPATFGHPTAKGATAVGAYDPFKPYLPEFFTSPGGDLQISYDSAGNRYAKPQTRRVPQVSGVDGGNTTFFTNDSLLDPDTQRNFFGTSASAPHVAARLPLSTRALGWAARFSIASASWRPPSSWSNAMVWMPSACASWAMA